MGIRSFDFFRKLNSDVGETTSAFGGFLTAIALILIATLTVNECRLYLKTEIDYQTVIDNDTQQTIEVYVDIILSVPCQVLSLDQQDEVGVHILDVSGSLIKRRLDPTRRDLGKPLGYGNPDYRGSEQELIETIEAINAGEQCELEGHFLVNKVPGNFHVSYHAQHQLTQRIIQRDVETYKRMRLDHSIMDIHFGDIPEAKRVLRRYPKAFQQYLSSWTSITKKSPSDTKMDYEYHINALPARFTDPDTNDLKTFYKYSIAEVQMPRAYTEMDAIYFRYQFSPVNMVYGFQSKSIYHLIVQLLAIIGGVFAVIGILNSIIQKAL